MLELPRLPIDSDLKSLHDYEFPSALSLEPILLSSSYNVCSSNIVLLMLCTLHALVRFDSRCESTKVDRACLKVRQFKGRISAN